MSGSKYPALTHSMHLVLPPLPFIGCAVRQPEASRAVPVIPQPLPLVHTAICVPAVALTRPAHISGRQTWVTSLEVKAAIIFPGKRPQHMCAQCLSQRQVVEWCILNSHNLHRCNIAAQSHTSSFPCHTAGRMSLRAHTKVPGHAEDCMIHVHHAYPWGGSLGIIQQLVLFGGQIQAPPMAPTLT